MPSTGSCANEADPRSDFEFYMKSAVIILWIAAVLLFVWLIVYQGVGDVVSALGYAGWGLLVISLFHLIPMIADMLSWYVIIPERYRPSYTRMLGMRWITESVNSLLPVAQVGGDLVRARMLKKASVPGAMSGASVIVDITAGVLSQVIFSLIGVFLLLQYKIDSSLSAPQLSIGVVLFGAMILSFYVLQRRGLFLKLAGVLEKIASGHDWLALAGGVRRLDRAVQRLYRRNRQFLLACSWRLFAWLLGTGEVWLALYFMGHPVSLMEALLLESLGQAIRAAAFAVPGALGVQEGGYLLLGGFIGLNPEISLALSLTKRVRELALGLPGLMVWQIVEGRQLWRDKRHLTQTQGKIQ